MVMEGRVEGRIGRGRRRGHLRRDIGGLARDIMCEYEDVGGLFGRGSGSEVVWFFFFFPVGGYVWIYGSGGEISWRSGAVYLT